MREFVFEVSITAIVRVRAETEADARQALTSSVFGSHPPTKLGWPMKRISLRARKARSPRLIFRLRTTPSSSGMSTRVVEDLLTASRLSISAQTAS